MTLLTRVAQSLGAFLAGLRNVAFGFAGLDASGKLANSVLPDSVVRTDGAGKIEGALLPDNVVRSDSNGKLANSDLPDSVVRTDGAGKIEGALLPDNVVRSDSNGKISVAMLDLGADAGLWNFVTGVDGGADAASAFDLTTLAQKDAGDAYLVETSGWFTLGVAGDEFEMSAGNALAFASTGGVVKLGNSDIGTASEFETALSAAYQAAL